jgi:DNA repair exonuclease SbcCD ATPase subunit
MNYNEQLQKLQKKVSQEKSVEAKLRELKSQKDELNSRVYVFKKTMKNEQADVERLERTSLSSVFYEMIGRKDEMLDKEKAEAYAATVKYDAAVEELRLIEEDLHRMETQLCDIIACKKEYYLLLEEKREAIKAVNSIEAERIFQIEEKIAEQKNHQKEIKEAVSAGTRALGSAISILSSLDNAQNWGTYDLVNGGLIAGMAKHSYLDEAQNKVITLQSQLRKFKTELTDITIQADMKVNVDGFLRFADYFYDGLFSDWAVLDRIGQSKSSVHSVKTKIENVLSKLDRMDRAAEQMIKQLEMERDNIVKSVDM